LKCMCNFESSWIYSCEYVSYTCKYDEWRYYLSAIYIIDSVWALLRCCKMRYMWQL